MANEGEGPGNPDEQPLIKIIKRIQNVWGPFLENSDHSENVTMAKNWILNWYTGSAVKGSELFEVAFEFGFAHAQERWKQETHFLS